MSWKRLFITARFLASRSMAPVSSIRIRWQATATGTGTNGFGCACCPPNIARLLASVGQYIYAESDAGLWVNLYVGGTADAIAAGNVPVRLTQETDYPVDRRRNANNHPTSTGILQFESTDSGMV